MSDTIRPICMDCGLISPDHAAECPRNPQRTPVDVARANLNWFRPLGAVGDPEKMAALFQMRMAEFEAAIREDQRKKDAGEQR